MSLSSLIILFLFVLSFSSALNNSRRLPYQSNVYEKQYHRILMSQEVRTQERNHDTTESGNEKQHTTTGKRSAMLRGMKRGLEQSETTGNDAQDVTNNISMQQKSLGERRVEDTAMGLGGFEYNDDVIGGPPGGNGGNGAGTGNSAGGGGTASGYGGYGSYGSYGGGVGGSSGYSGGGAGANYGSGASYGSYGGGASGGAVAGYGTGSTSGYGGAVGDGASGYGGAASGYGDESSYGSASASGYGSYSGSSAYGGYGSSASSSNYGDSYSDSWGSVTPGSSSFKSKMNSINNPFPTKVSLFPALLLFTIVCLAGMLLTAHQMEHSPEGTYANCCRVSLATVTCVYGVIYNLYHCRLGDIPQVVCATDEDVLDEYTDEELERMKLRPGIERALDVEHRKALRKVGIEMNKIKVGDGKGANGGAVPSAGSIQR